MATYYKFFDNRSKSAEKFPLKIAISHKKKTRYILTGFYLTEEQWDAANKKISSKYKNSGRANVKVERKYSLVGEVVESLRPHWKELNVDQIKEAVESEIEAVEKNKANQDDAKIVNTALNSRSSGSTCFYEYTKKVIREFHLKDRGGSAGVMQDTIRSLTDFTRKDRLPFSSIDEDFLNDYEGWYIKQYNSKGERNNVNGLGFKTKEIRRIFNMAIKDKGIVDVTQDMYPFGRHGYSIKKVKTDNKNIDPSEIAKIYDLNLTPGTKLWHHLNYFKYYFECWGMNFADIAHLRVYQVQDGRLKYRRRKTRWSNNAKQFNIEHSPTAQRIIDYYTRGKKPGDFVFPIIDSFYYLNDELEDKELEAKNKALFEKKWSNARCNHIRRLKTISKKAGLKENVSIYVGRHSFFSIALKHGVSKSEISEMAGHSNFQVTEAYLDGFSGEQLASSANMVRNVVASHSGVNVQENILDDNLKLNSTGEEKTVNDYLLNLINSDPDKGSNPTTLVIELLQETDCNDGMKAQEYVNLFLADNNEKVQAKAS